MENMLQCHSNHSKRVYINSWIHLRTLFIVTISLLYFCPLTSCDFGNSTNNTHLRSRNNIETTVNPHDKATSKRSTRERLITFDVTMTTPVTRFHGSINNQTFTSRSGYNRRTYGNITTKRRHGNPDLEFQAYGNDGSISLNDTLIILSFSVIFVVGTLGNLLVCFVFRPRANGKRSVTEYLLFHLGLVDFIASTINPPLFIYWTVTSYSRWDFGYTGCIIFPNVSIIVANLSALIMIILALDRYRAIMTPFRGHYNMRQIRFALVGAVLLSMLSCVHRMSTQGIYEGRCEIPYVTDLRFAIPALCVLISRDIIFTGVFVFSHSRIIAKLKSSNLSLMNSHLTRNENQKEAKRISYVLLAMMLAFLLLVLPRDVLHITYITSWLAGNGFAFTEVLLPINAWFKVLHASNSCVNVFIYSRMHRVFHDRVISWWHGLINGKRFSRISSEEVTAFVQCDTPVIETKRRKSESSVLLDRVQSIFRTRPGLKFANIIQETVV